MWLKNCLLLPVQLVVQKVLVVLALLSVPVLLFGKPTCEYILFLMRPRYSVSLCLSELFRPFIPRLVAFSDRFLVLCSSGMRTDVRWWLMKAPSTLDRGKQREELLKRR